MSHQPVIVVSATRFFQGGTLVIVGQCLKFLSKHYSPTHQVKVLVFKKELYEQMDPGLKDLKGIEWLEFPKARKSVIYRLFQEYITFKKLSRKLQPVLWLSLQDSTPRVEAKIRAVYFHNPLLDIPQELIYKFWKHQPRLAVLRLLYKYLYTSGINKNDFVITQQEGIAALLEQNYRITPGKIRVFPPTAFLMPKARTNIFEHARVEEVKTERVNNKDNRLEKPFTFIFPSTAFYYKNHELIISACELLNSKLVAADDKKQRTYKVILTIDGSENRHVQRLVKFAQEKLPQIECVGFLNRDALFEYYKQADCMIFPSLLESWGLPLSEFAAQHKPILCANLSYGRSTLRDYHKVAFFDPRAEEQLARLMLQAIKGSIAFTDSDLISKADFQFVYDWQALFRELLEPNA